MIRGKFNREQPRDACRHNWNDLSRTPYTKNETALLQRVIMFFIVRAAKNRINKCGAEHFQFNELDRTSTNSLKVVNTIFDHYKKYRYECQK